MHHFYIHEGKTIFGGAKIFIENSVKLEYINNMDYLDISTSDLNTDLWDSDLDPVSVGLFIYLSKTRDFRFINVRGLLTYVYKKIFIHKIVCRRLPNHLPTNKTFMSMRMRILLQFQIHILYCCVAYIRNV